MLKRFTIAQKLPVLFAAMSLASVLVVGIVSYVEMSRGYEKEDLAKINLLEEEFQETILQNYDAVRADMVVISNTSTTIDAFTRLGAGYQNLANEGENPKTFLQNSYITQNPYPADQRHLASTIEDGSYYSKFHAKYHDWFKTMLVSYDYYDIFLVDPEGNVIYSVFKENDFADNVSSNLLKSTGLAQAVQAATENEIGLTDFDPYTPSAGILASFMSTQVRNSYDQVIGTLVIQLKPDSFQAVLSDHGVYGDAARSFILDSEYDVIFQSKGENYAPVGPDFFDGSDVIAKIKAGEHGIILTTEPETGRKVYAAYGVQEAFGQKTGVVVFIDHASAMSDVNALRNKMIWLAGLTFLTVVAIGLFLARSISKPLFNLQNALQRIARSGDLTVRVSVDGKDEVALSTRAVDELIEMTQSTFLTIKSGSVTAADAAEKMLSTARIMAENAETQSSSVEELSSSVEETESQVKSNAEAAREANALVEGTISVVQEGKGRINRMVESMDDIKSSSEDIAKIIKVIDEIAFQTNLLALNAAVEAARAGQHGRGFAVVAAEVRNLAGRSAKAAQETSELIVGSSKRVEAGVEVSSQAREAFDKIAEDISSVSDLVGKISMASDEQARGVTYINRAIQEISDAAMTNAVRAEELNVVAKELASSNEGVLGQIDQFELGNASNKRRGKPSKREEIRVASEANPAKRSKRDTKPASAAPKSQMMEKSSSASTDMDERGFGNY